MIVAIHHIEGQVKPDSATEYEAIGGKGDTVARFFFGAAVGGRLRLRDIPDWGYWNPKSIAYWDETHIDGVSRLALAGRKIRSAAELDDAILASLDLPGIQGLWIHESLAAAAGRSWKTARRTVRNRLEMRAPAAAAVLITAACFAAGMAVAVNAPTKLARAPSPPAAPRLTESARPHETARVIVPPAAAVEPSRTAVTRPAVRPVGAVPPLRRPAAIPHPAMRSAFRQVHTAGAARTPVRRVTAAFAVTVGTFASAEHADRIKHLVQSKGYIVRVVSDGRTSQVVTPPYATREQAERVARALAAAGLPAELTSWRGL
jgi:SPOR domain